jgi:hypothetical protein
MRRASLSSRNFSRPIRNAGIAPAPRATDCATKRTAALSNSQ